MKLIFGFYGAIFCVALGVSLLFVYPIGFLIYVVLLLLIWKLKQEKTEKKFKQNGKLFQYHFWNNSQQTTSCLSLLSFWLGTILILINPVIGFVLYIVAAILYFSKKDGEKKCSKVIQAESNKVQKEERDINNRLDSMLKENESLIIKFLEIAERKVSILDEYGFEDDGALQREIEEVIVRLPIVEKVFLNEIFVSGQDEYEKLRAASRLEDVLIKIREDLKCRFIEYHNKHKSICVDLTEISGIAGVDFEVFIATFLKQLGYDVSMTPATGDQGADLILRSHTGIIVIQAKRYSKKVTNKAVQEVIGAIRFYGADEGWVVTNSLFTKSATELAQKAKVRLFDGHDLKQFSSKVESILGPGK